MSKICVDAIVEGTKSLVFMCPACGEHHHAPIGRWTWNRDTKSPSIWPSIVVERGTPGNPNHERCHCVVREGKIRYLADCTHKMAGTTVSMPDHEWRDEPELAGVLAPMPEPEG